MPVTVARDLWDWLLYALSAIAAITAIIAFSAWALQLRRRPKVGFLWRISPDDDPAHLADWPPGEERTVKAGQPFLMAAAIQNTGDRAGGDTLVNFVVPDCFELRLRARPDDEPFIAVNDTAGLPPDNRVVFFAPQPDPWTPVNWHLTQFWLRYVGGDQYDLPLTVRLLFDVSDSRFNSRGRRRLPSRLPTLEFEGAPVGTPWPRRPRGAGHSGGPEPSLGPGGLPAGQPRGCPRPHRAPSR